MASPAILRIIANINVGAGFGTGGSQLAPPPPIPGFYGDGSDGDVVLPPGNTNLFRDMYYRSLVVPFGSVLSPQGFAVYATRLIDISGQIDVSGSPATGAVHGAGTAFGLDGGDGAVNAPGGNSTAGAIFGGRGGDGGPSGVPLAGGVALGSPSQAPRASALVDALFSTLAGIGGGGGAGGGSPGFAGGGGGGGGGRMLLQAPLIIVRSTGRLLAVGGGGAAGAGGTAGPGGGGGGGVIWLISAAIVVEPGGTISVVGGLRGGGGAFNGNPGFYIPLAA